MAVVADRNFHPGPNAIIRPRSGVFLDSQPPFAGVRATKWPPWVFSRQGALIHRVAFVEIHWWLIAGRGHIYVRTNRPRLHAMTVCGYRFFLEATRGRTCHVPSPDALVCGRCLKGPRNFPRGAAPAVPYRDAKVRLGCLDPVE